MRGRTTATSLGIKPTCNTGIEKPLDVQDRGAFRVSIKSLTTFATHSIAYSVIRMQVYCSSKSPGGRLFFMPFSRFHLRMLIAPFLRQAVRRGSWQARLRFPRPSRERCAADSFLRRSMLYLMRCHLQTGTGRRCMRMENIALPFLISVMAGVVCHYLCKWLDERVSGNKPER